MAGQSRRGYLLLADISGYTSFLATVELEHAHEILSDLLEVIVAQLKSLLRISKLEGDAVFAYVDEARLPRGETLLELIETTYVAFRQRRDTSSRATTCTCRACQSMPSLELKFFVHHGSFIVQNVAGIRELVGSDVNQVHRLMKNHVFESTGWTAYALFTRAAMQAMKLELKDVHHQTESYEHLGKIETITIDLLPRFDAIVSSQSFYITADEADYSRTHEFGIAQAELWQILTSPEALTRLAGNTNTWTALRRPKGRTGVGAVNHCVHSRGTLQTTIVDWRPFDYFTARGVAGKQKWYEMAQLTPRPDTNSVLYTSRWKSDMGYPRWLRRLVGSFLVRMLVRRFISATEDYIAEIQSKKNELDYSHATK